MMLRSTVVVALLVLCLMISTPFANASSSGYDDDDSLVEDLTDPDFDLDGPIDGVDVEADNDDDDDDVADDDLDVEDNIRKSVDKCGAIFGNCGKRSDCSERGLRYGLCPGTSICCIDKKPSASKPVVDDRCQNIGGVCNTEHFCYAKSVSHKIIWGKCPGRTYCCVSRTSKKLVQAETDPRCLAVQGLCVSQATCKATPMKMISYGKCKGAKYCCVTDPNASPYCLTPVTHKNGKCVMRQFDGSKCKMPGARQAFYCTNKDGTGATAVIDAKPTKDGQRIEYTCDSCERAVAKITYGAIDSPPGGDDPALTAAAPVPRRRINPVIPERACVAPFNREFPIPDFLMKSQAGLTNPQHQTMVDILGEPCSQAPSCKAVSDPKLKALLRNGRVGHVSFTMIKPARDALMRVLTRIQKEKPELFKAIRSSGSLCCRNVRGSKTRWSNHSWGTAMDFNINGLLDARTDAEAQCGLLDMVPYFNAEGFFWGGGYSAKYEDAMHFEISQQTILAWKAKGLV